MPEKVEEKKEKEAPCIPTVEESITAENIHHFKVNAKSFVLPFCTNIKKDSKVDEDHALSNTASLVIVTQKEIVFNGQHYTKFSDAA